MKKKNQHNEFNVPPGYFEGFTDRLLDKMSKDETQHDEVNLPKKDGFKIPNNYFNDLNKALLNQQDEPETKVVELKPNKNKLYYMAAAIAAVILLTIGFQTYILEETTIETVAKTDIDAYFENNGYNMSTFELAEVIPVDNLEVADIIDTQLNSENILDYLDQNIEEIEELNLSDYDY